MSQAIGLLVKALSRSLKAAGYYEDSHPILTQIRQQALEALQKASLGGQSVTIGSNGTKLVFDATAPAMGDPAAAQLAEHLFARSIVAIRFDKTAGAKELGYLMTSLAETPDKIRAAGGFSAVLGRYQTRGITPVEVDFEALFSGRNVEINEIAGQDPVVERALKEVLQVKERRSRVGDALGVDIAALATPESLGTFLDDLMEKAEPGVVEQPSEGGGGGGSGGGGAGKSAGVSAGTVKSRIGGGGNVRVEALNPDDLAELAAKAYFGNHEYMVSQGTPEENLAESAKLLANVLGRLRPDARFVMLKKLASQTRDANVPTPAKKRGGKNLSQAVSDKLVIEAISSILGNQGSDSDTIEAVAELMQQIRPIESERKRLLAELDNSFRATGHSIDGIVWQEIQAKALQSNGLGMLELSFRESLDSLVVAAQERIQRADGPPAVRQAFDTLKPQAVARRYKDIWMGILSRMQQPPDSLLTSGTDLAKSLEAAGDPEAAQEVMGFLVAQSAKVTPSSGLHAQMKEYLSGPQGMARTIQIVERFNCQGPVVAEAMLTALEGSTDAKTKELIFTKFKTIDQAGLNAIAVTAQSAKPMRVFNLIRIGSQISGKTGSQMARLGMRNRDALAKEMAIKALAEHPAPESISLLNVAAGGNGDEESIKVLYLDPRDPSTEKRLRQYQTLAITALGDSRSPEAVRPLWNLLIREATLGKNHIDQFRPLIAKALSNNATRESRSALNAGAANKNKAVRDACARYATPGGS